MPESLPRGTGKQEQRLVTVATLDPGEARQARAWHKNPAMVLQR